MKRYGLYNDSVAEFQQEPLSFELGGFYNYDYAQLSSSNSRGYYWTKTAPSNYSGESANKYAGAFLIASGSASTNGTFLNYRGAGYALRCVAR